MPCDAPPAIVRIQDDHGGEIGRYLAQAGLFRACHARPRIGGACFSACTIYLGVPGACAEPTAVFGFHAAYYPGQFGAPPDALVAGATAAMLSSYPAAIKAWLGHRLSVGMRYLPAWRAARMGAVPLCRKWE